MTLSSSVVRANLRILSPLLKRGDLQASRDLQNKIGDMLALMRAHEIDISEPLCIGGEYEVCWASPKYPPGPGIIVYLHGGGYTAGDLPYAAGFGSALAQAACRRVLCVGYRLAPEHPFPAALEDALSAYRHLLDTGYAPEDIILCGESAGGGLIFSLCLKLKELNLPMPAGLIPISPWTDLTLSGESYTTNLDKDITLSRPMLDYYVRSYVGKACDAANPLISPLFGDFAGFPPCLIFAGGDELLLSDAVAIAGKLEKQGVDVRLHVEENMWHAYVLYGTHESVAAMNKIAAFIEERIK
ncbi:MAG TPA: alpha/beta hydrolase [Clostridiales bacterium]|jgi:acetyl esterase/lipase|nr:alpha/beta hydrolase [Clostridiales bacterium]